MLLLPASESFVVPVELLLPEVVEEAVAEAAREAFVDGAAAPDSTAGRTETEIRFFNLLTLSEVAEYSSTSATDASDP